MLSDQGSNLDSSDPESDVLPITPSDNIHLRSAKLYKFINVVHEFKVFYTCVDFVQVSLSATVRLNTIFELVESGSTQK